MTSCVVWGVASGVLSALLSWVWGWLWLRRNASSLIRGFGRGWAMHTPFLFVAATFDDQPPEFVVKVRTEEAFDAFVATVHARFESSKE